LLIPTGAAAGKVLTSDASGNATWQISSAGSGWAYDGNTVSAIKKLGTVDNYDLPVITNNEEQLRITAAGNIGLGTTTPISKLNVNGVVTITGGAGSELLGGQFSGIQLVGGYSTPVSGRMIIGDNSGWKFNISTRDDQSNLADLITFQDNGFVGIGTTSPDEKLRVKNGNIRLDDGYKISFTDNGEIQSFDNNHRILFRRSEDKMELQEFGDIIFSPGTSGGIGTAKMVMLANGNMGIGTTTPQAKLAVNGDIFSRKVKVTQTSWPDYVFHPTYSLRPLAELEQFIQQYHHLPDVPSSEDVQQNGLDLGEGQAVLLKKIEELTLYLIEQNKTQEQLIKKVEQLSTENKELKKRINQMK